MPDEVQPKIAVPAFWQRVVLMPLRSSFWLEARGWSAGEILLPLLVLATLLGAGLGLYRGFGLRNDLLTHAAKFDASYDPIVYEAGTLRTLGPRLWHMDDPKGGSTILVDPDETIPESALTGERNMVFRKTVFVRIDHGKREEVPLKTVTDLLGIDQLRIDGPALRAWTERKGTGMVLSMTAFLGLFALVENAIAFPLHALLAGLLLLALRGNALRLKLEQCFRIALAALAIKPWAILVLYLAGTGPGLCLGLLVWPATALLLALIATRSYRPTRPPDLAPPPAPPSPER